jgi:hemerythrin-like domain-containing protein
MIVDYLDSFHQRFHHPKEDRYLFEALRTRTDQADDTLAQLEREHAEGDGQLARLSAAINGAQSGTIGVAELADEVERYAEFHWRHMRTEEDIVMPLAERALRKQDWDLIDAAFADNDDPVFGTARRAEYQRLLAVIAEHAPPPLGAGDSRD